MCYGVSDTSSVFQAIAELAMVRYICWRGLGANHRAARYKLSLAAKLRGSRVQAMELERRRDGSGPAGSDQVMSGGSFRGWVELTIKWTQRWREVGT